jgi:hypothetical protein
MNRAFPLIAVAAVTLAGGSEFRDDMRTVRFEKSGFS